MRSCKQTRALNVFCEPKPFRPMLFDMRPEYLIEKLFITLFFMLLGVTRLTDFNCLNTR